MTISEKLASDIKSALKANDKTKLSILRMVKAAVKYKEIDKGDPLNDDEMMAVFNSFMKKGRESFEQFSKAGRDELASKEKEEMEIIQMYLPEQLSEDEIAGLVKDAISETGAEGSKDFGKVMKAVMAKTKGKADGKVVSGLVKKGLEGA
jgi:uncharacterized protein YqeY